MRDVLQETGFFLLELQQSLAQPVKTLTELFQIAGSGHRGGFVELAIAEATNCLIYLPDWTGD